MRRWKTKRTSSGLELSLVFFLSSVPNMVGPGRRKKSEKKLINIFIVFRLPLSVSLLFLIPFASVCVCVCKFVSKCAPSTTSQFREKHSFSVLFQFHLMCWFRWVLSGAECAGNRQQREFRFASHPLATGRPIVFCVTIPFDRCANGMHERIVSACRFH